MGWCCYVLRKMYSKFRTNVHFKPSQASSKVGGGGCLAIIWSHFPLFIVLMLASLTPVLGSPSNFAYAFPETLEFSPSHQYTFSPSAPFPALAPLAVALKPLKYLLYRLFASPHPALPPYSPSSACPPHQSYSAGSSHSGAGCCGLVRRRPPVYMGHTEQPFRARHSCSLETFL